MAITRIDCSFFRGTGPSAETSSYVALNPRASPGDMVLAGSCAVRDSIGSQVASKLALQHFVAGVLDYFARVKAAENLGSKLQPVPPTSRSELGLQALEDAFRVANTSVYEFGHKLAAGGRMAASLIALVIEGNTIAAGRVGPGVAFLIRAGAVFPFFQSRKDATTDPKVLEAFIGSNSLVPVDLASVPLKEDDCICIFSSEPSYGLEHELPFIIKDMWPRLEIGGENPELNMYEQGKNPCDEVVSRLYRDAGELAFAMMAVVGPDTIYLHQLLREDFF